MNRKKENYIKNLLRQTEVDKAPSKFTDAVMKDIATLSDENLLKDAKLSSLFKNTLVEKPSSNFTATVISTIELKNSIEYQPVISKKSWFYISITVISLLVYTFYNSAPTESSFIAEKLLPHINSFTSAFSSYELNLNFPSILVTSLIALSSLLIIDFYSKQKISI